MSTASESLAGGGLAEESRKKRRRIATSWWPRARLVGEILYHQMDRDRLFTQASALTYKTLFSLLPIFVLSLLILSAISTGEGKSQLDNAVQRMFFKQLAMDKLTITDSSGNVVKMTRYVEDLINRAKDAISGKATGLVAFAILLYGAISLMFVIEQTFNSIYGAVKPRSWPRRIMLYWCVLTLGPVGVAGSIILGRTAFTLASTHGASAWLMAQATMFSSFIVSWLLVLLMYRIIPDTHVRWRPAVFSAFLVALFWEIGKWGFGLYVRHAVVNNVYGSLALLPLFMMWLYMTWSVVLIGLELTYMQQFWPLLKRQFFFTRAGSRGTRAVNLSDIRWVLSLGALIGRRFKEGKPTPAYHAAEILTLPNDVASALLEALEKAGLLHCVRDDEGGTYALARPAESITAHDLLLAVKAVSQVPPELAHQVAHHPPLETPAARELDDLETQWARQRTLADLTNNPA